MATAETLMKLDGKHQNNLIEVSDLKNHQRTHTGVFHPDNKLKTKSEKHIENHIVDNTEAINCAEKENSIIVNQLNNETENIALDFTVKKPEQNDHIKSVISDESIKLSSRQPASMSKSFKENVLSHKLTHKDEKLSCNFCGKSFTTRFSVKRHEEIHTLSPLERSYPCNFCGLRYMKKENVINHQKQNCPKKSQSQDLQLLAQISSPGLEKVGNDYICTYESCLFTNTQLSQMIQHFTNKHPEIKAVDLNNIKNASKPVTEKIYHANIQKSNDLKKMNSNNNKCAYCGKKVPKIEASGQNEACKKALKKSKDIEVINDWTVVKVEPLKSIKLEPLKTRLIQSENSELQVLPDQALEREITNTPEQKENCNYCNQRYLKKKMDNHTRSGKCIRYSPYIKFTPTVFHCNLCLNSKSTKRNVHCSQPLQAFRKRSQG